MFPETEGQLAGRTKEQGGDRKECECGNGLGTGGGEKLSLPHHCEGLVLTVF